jgi:signal transduction histidine kinase
VVIADDGPLVRALFRRILERSTDAIVVAEAADGQEAIEAVGVHQPDLVLLDIAMPNTDGLTAIPEIRRRSPATRVVLLSGFEGWQLDREATVHAADGYIEKQLDSESLVAKLREACTAAVADAANATTARVALGLTAPDIESDATSQNARAFRLASLAAHDLRTPIQLIDGFARLLAENYGDVLDEAGGEFVSWILDAAASLERMVSDMLEFALVDASAPRWTTVDLSELFGSVRSRLAPVLDRTRVSLSWEPLPTVVGDPDDMRRLFGHLLTNAITFVGTDPPWVHVEADRTDTGWRITVTDNGIGVPEHEAAAIFDGLHRLHGKDAYPGTGVGLAVCKRLIERRGGTIGVEPGEDGGSRFWFTIPDEVPE